MQQGGKFRLILAINIQVVHCQLPRWTTTVLPAKSDSDFMFCLQSYKGLISDRSLVYKSYPQDRINTQVIYRFALAQVKCTC